MFIQTSFLVPGGDWSSNNATPQRSPACMYHSTRSSLCQNRLHCHSYWQCFKILI